MSQQNLLQSTCERKGNIIISRGLSRCSVIDLQSEDKKPQVHSLIRNLTVSECLGCARHKCNSVSKNAPQPVFRKDRQEKQPLQGTGRRYQVSKAPNAESRTPSAELWSANKCLFFDVQYMVKVHGLRLELDHHWASSEKLLSPGRLSFCQP